MKNIIITLLAIVGLAGFGFLVYNNSFAQTSISENTEVTCGCGEGCNCGKGESCGCKEGSCGGESCKGHCAGGCMGESCGK